MLPKSLLRLRLANPASARTFVSTAVRQNMAKLTVIGRLAANPEQVLGKTGKTYMKYSLGCTGYVPRGTPREEAHTSWYDVICFDEKSTEYLSTLKKGALCYVEADVSTRTYEDKTGNTRKGWDIIHRRLLQLSKPKSTEEPVEEDFE